MWEHVRGCTYTVGSDLRWSGSSSAFLTELYPWLQTRLFFKEGKPYNSHIETLKGKLYERDQSSQCRSVRVRVNLEDLEADRTKRHGLKVPTLRVRACCRSPVQKKPATCYMRRNELRWAADMFNNHTLSHLLQ